MAKQITGFAEVDAMLKEINKQFKKEDVSSYEVPDPIPTGSDLLDSALKIGGIARHRVTEILGEPSGGKTSLAMQILANEQALRKAKGETDSIDLVVDLEHTITQEFMEGFGIDTSMVLHRRPDSAEEALTLAIELPKTGKIGMVIVDSVGAMQAKAEQDKEAGETLVGGVSKLMHWAMRQISKLCETTQTTYIFINHITYKPTTYGDPRTTPGGNALPFFATMRLEVLKSKPSPDKPDAFIMHVKVKKNKCSAPCNDDIYFTFYYGKGTDAVAEILDQARVLGYLRNSGGQSKIRYDLDSDEWIIPNKDMSKGKEGCYQFYKNNPEALQELRNLVIQH